MKRIQYTSEQEKKLIEMSLFLFPEYKEIHINGAWIYFNKELRPFDSIPIFEFCMTHLASKMIELGELPSFNNKLDYEFFSILQSSWWESHPVDYLYEEFKKLN